MMPTTVKGFLLNNGIVLITVAMTMVVNLAVLDQKFSTQAEDINVNTRLLGNIGEDLERNTLKLNDLVNADLRLEARLSLIEGYVPTDIVKLEKDVLSLTKDHELLAFKVETQLGSNK